MSEAGQSLLVGRLSPDGALARNAAFALFVRTYLEGAGLLPAQLGPDTPASALPGAIGAVHAENRHVVAHFAAPARRDALSTLDAGALRELLGWLQAQRVHQEEPQVAYELGMLALGVELPAIVVRDLRRAALRADSLVAELPDGAGYATVFLSTLHPHWNAAGGARLFVAGVDAEQLAGWAMLLLSRALRPPPGSVTRVRPEVGGNGGPAGTAPRLPLTAERFDLAVVYNPVPWLASPQAVANAVAADAVVLV